MSQGSAYCQRGIALIEVLIAILVFSFGMLGLLGLEANAVKVVLAAKETGSLSWTSRAKRR